MAQAAVKKKRRGRRILVALGLAAVVLATARYTLLDPERYRAQIVEAVESATGLRVEIGSMDLGLFPSIRLSASDVAIGDEEFNARARSISATAKLRPLFRRAVRIGTVRIDGLVLQLPESVTKIEASIESIVDHASAESSGESSWSVRIDEIAIAGARVETEETSGALLEFELTLRDVVSDRIGIRLAAGLARYGDDAGFDADITVGLRDGALYALNGAGRLTAFPLGEFDRDGTPTALAGAEFSVSGDRSTEITYSIKGRVDSETEPGLVGIFEGAGAWDDSAATLKSFQWTAPMLNVTASGRRDADGAVLARVDRFDARGDGLDALLAFLPHGAVVASSTDGASFTVDALEISRDSAGALSFDGGRIEFSGLELSLPDGDPIVEDLRGRAAADGGGLRIDELSARTLDLKGRVAPVKGGVALELSGTADLDRAYLAAFVDVDSVRELEGHVTITRIAGTWASGQDGLPEDLAVEGNLRDGRVVLARGEDVEIVAPVNIEFTSDADGIDTKLTAMSDRSGAWSVAGRYTFVDRVWQGEAAVNVPKLAGSFVADGEQRAWVEAALAPYGRSNFRTTIRTPRGDNSDLVVRVRREGGPTTLEGEVVFAKDEATDALRLGAIEVTSSVEIAQLGEKILRDLEVEGIARLSFSRDASTGALEARVDLAAGSVRAGEAIEKRRGDALAFTLWGESEDTWRIDRALLDCVGVTIPIRFTEGAIVVEAKQLDVGPLAKLLPEGSTAHGTLDLRYVSEPLSMSAAFGGAGFTLSDTAGVESITGTADYHDGALVLDEIRIQGDGTDCTINVRDEGGVWTGGLDGSSLDLNAFEALWEAIGSLSAVEEEPADAAPDSDTSYWDDPVYAALSIDLGRLRYNRGELTDVHVRIVSDDKAIRLRDIMLRPYEGEFTGRVDVLRAEGGASQLKLYAKVESLDARILDDLLFDEPRNLTGSITGSANIAAPFGSYKTVLAGATGNLALSGTDGSFGQLGFATKLLTVLKTTEIVNLKAPSLRDEGLTYRTFDVVAPIDNGLLTFDEFALDGGAYAMEGKGTVNFATEETDVMVFTRFLESVSRIVDKVPIVGAAATELTTKNIGVSVRFSGSPYALEAGLTTRDTASGVLTAPVRAGEAVVEGVKGVFKKLLKKDD